MMFSCIVLQSERGGHTLVLETSDKQQLRANLSSPPVSYAALCTITKQHIIHHMYLISIELRLTEGDQTHNIQLVW